MEYLALWEMRKRKYKLLPVSQTRAFYCVACAGEDTLAIRPSGAEYDRHGTDTPAVGVFDASADEARHSLTAFVQPRQQLRYNRVPYNDPQYKILYGSLNPTCNEYLACRRNIASRKPLSPWTLTVAHHGCANTQQTVMMA